MDKTVTADFESIDMATFAAKNVTDHFDGVKKVKVSYQKSKGNNGGLLSSFALPYGPLGGTGTPLGTEMNVGMNNGLLPVAASLALYRDDGSTGLDHKRAKVSITAPEALIQPIESTLHTGGGLNIKES